MRRMFSNSDRQRFETTKFSALLGGAVVAFITHLVLFEAGARFELSDMVISLVALVGFGISSLLIFTYIGSVFAFWRIEQAPYLRPFVYKVRVALYTGLGLAALAITQTEGVMSIGGYYFAAIFFVAAAYDVYILVRIGRLQFGSHRLEQSVREDTETLDTGRLGTTDELEEMGSFETGSFFLGRINGRAVFATDKISSHIITYGEPGCGKGINTVIPNLLHWPGSAFVTDPKGELAAVTANYRRNVLGHNVIYLNPWNLHSLPNTCYNPLELLLNDVAMTRSLTAPPNLKHREIADAESLANILLPEPPASSGDNNKWIRANARRMLKAFMLYLADSMQESCHLVTMREMLSLSDEAYASILEDMLNSTAFGGELAQDAEVIANSFVNTREQHEYARDEAQKAVQLYDSYSHLGRSVRSSQVNMRDFVERPTTVYLIIPKEYKISHASWLSLVVVNAMEAVGRYGRRNSPILCMLDEFANLGKLPNVRTALAEYRGNGLRAWMIVQNKRQLKTVYGDDESNALEQLCGIEQYIGVNHEQAKDLSERIGVKTVRAESITNLGPNFDDTYRQARRSVSEQSKPILSPADIMSLTSSGSRDDPGKQLVFLKGRAYIIDKCPYWFIEPWRSHAKDNPLEGPAPRPTTGVIHVAPPQPGLNTRRVTRPNPNVRMRPLRSRRQWR